MSHAFSECQKKRKKKRGGEGGWDGGKRSWGEEGMGRRGTAWEHYLSLTDTIFCCAEKM